MPIPADYLAAEHYMVRAFAKRKGFVLSADRKIPVANGHLEIDGRSDDNSVLIEAYAGQKRPKPGSGQEQKVMADAFKLRYAGDVVGASQLFLLVCNADVAAPFSDGSKKWVATALKQCGIEVEIQPLPPRCKKRLA